MGWSWAAACGVQGREISCGLAQVQLVYCTESTSMSVLYNNAILRTSDVNKTKFFRPRSRPRPPEIKKGTWWT